MIITFNEDEEFLSDSTLLESSVIMAENELYCGMYNIFENLISGTSGLTYIHESIRETIVRFINKVIQGLQKAWETFASKMETMFQGNLKRIKNIKYTDEDLHSIVVSNFPVYDDNKINNIKLVPFDYNGMKEFLKDDRTYIGHYYSQFAPKDGEKLKDTMFKYCMTERLKEFNLTVEDLNNIIKYCDNYKTYRDQIRNDLELINGSAKAIQTIIDNANETKTEIPEAQAQESYSLNSLDDCYSLLESFFLTEDEKTGTNVNTTVEPAKGAAAGSQVNNPQNAPGVKKEDPKDEEMKVKQDKVTEADKNSQMVKDVQTYMSASTKVLVAKMRLLRVRYSNYDSIIGAVVNKIDKAAAKRQKAEAIDKDRTEVQQVETDEY